MLKRKFEILNMLRSEGIVLLDAYSTIFGIAAIGLLIGKDKLITIIHDKQPIENKKYFDELVKAEISKTDLKKMEIVEDALTIIPFIISGQTLSKITEEIMNFELLEIILCMDDYDYELTSKGMESISSVPWINRLVVELFKLHKGKTLLNVDCGSGEFIKQMIESDMGVENATGYTSYVLNCNIAKIKSYFMSDTVEVYSKGYFEATEQNESYDMIYNSYPMALKYQTEDMEPIVKKWKNPPDMSKRYSSALLFIIDSLQKLTTNGMLIALVNNGVLINEIDKSMRKYLIDYNYVSAIINLPIGIISGTGVSTSLVVLNKNSPVNEYIQLIDATSIYTKYRRCSVFTEENIERIIQLYTEKKETDKSILVTKQEVIGNDYNLSGIRYIRNDLVNACTLGDVSTSIFRGYQVKAKELDAISTEDKKTTDYRIINVSDIQQDGTVSEDLQAVDIKDERKIYKYCVEDGDIIITAKNTVIKAAIYRDNPRYKAIITGNLIAIRLDKEKMNPYYIKSFMDSKSGQTCLKAIQTGTSIISINPNSLKDMKISRLDIEKQNEIAKEYQSTYEEMIEYKNLYKSKMEQLNDIYRE